MALKWVICELTFQQSPKLKEGLKSIVDKPKIGRKNTWPTVIIKTSSSTVYWIS